jgi:DNA-binding NarL/FixJ family response regulator
MTIRIVIADDHKIVRRGIRTFLELDPELVVVGEAADGTEAVRLYYARLLKRRQRVRYS